jgi:hypothetical protein
MFSINEIRRIAGLTTLTEAEELEQHMADEKKLFENCCSCLQDVIKMCKDRLKDTQNITPEQKKQYQDLHECAKHCCDVMHEHLKTYK